MAREHSKIKMTDEELHAFLASDRRMVLATVTPEGDPWGDLVAYTFHDDRLWFRVPTATRTHANLAADPRVCCVVESKPESSSYYDIQGAMLHDSARAEAEPAPMVRDALAATPDPVEPSGPRTGDVF